MAINLDNVKAITHDNKDVIKIEDSNGNTIWTKPPQDKYIYYLGGTTSLALNTRTLEATPFNAGTNTFPSSHTEWTDGTDVFISRGSLTDSKYQRRIRFNGTSTDSVSKTSWTGLPSTFYGYNVFTDGTDVYYADSGINSVYKRTAGTNTWTSYTIGNTMTGYSGNNIFRFKGVTYCIKDSNHVVKWNTSTNQWTFVKNDSGTVQNLSGKNFWSPDGTHLFYTDGSFNYKVNPRDFSFSICFWSGASTSSTAVDNMFMIGSDVYMTVVVSSAFVTYKLDLTSVGSTTLVWTDATSEFTLPSGRSFYQPVVDEDGDATPSCGFGPKARDFN